MAHNEADYADDIMSTPRESKHDMAVRVATARLVKAARRWVDRGAELKETHLTYVRDAVRELNWATKLRGAERRAATKARR